MQGGPVSIVKWRVLIYSSDHCGDLPNKAVMQVQGWDRMDQEQTYS